MAHFAKIDPNTKEVLAVLYVNDVDVLDEPVESLKEIVSQFSNFSSGVKEMLNFHSEILKQKQLENISRGKLFHSWSSPLIPTRQSQQIDITTTLQNRLNDALRTRGMEVDVDPDIPGDNIIGFTIRLDWFDKLIRNIFKDEKTSPNNQPPV